MDRKTELQGAQKGGIRNETSDAVSDEKCDRRTENSKHLDTSCDAKPITIVPCVEDFDIVKPISRGSFG